MQSKALILMQIYASPLNFSNYPPNLIRFKNCQPHLEPEAVWSEGFNPRSQLAVLQRLKPLLHRLRPGSPQSPDCGRNHLSDTTIDRSLSHPRPRLPPVVNCALT